MGAISTSDAKGIFTKMLAAVLKERISPTAFLRSFFTTVESPTLEVAIEVQRGTERIAVDVQRGTEGNRNSFERSNEKIFIPPYYREYFDNHSLRLYDRLFGTNGMIDSAIFSALLEEVAGKYQLLQDKIERAYELQCAQVLETGVVELKNGINIDFKRKAGSLADLTGNPWTDDTKDPVEDVKNGCQWLRENGKSQGGIFNIIMGSKTKTAFDNNKKVIEKANLRRVDHLNISMPQRNSVGATSHGQFAAGDYIVNLWTYPEIYEDATGQRKPYIHPKKFDLLPERPNLIMAFGAVPRLLNTNNAGVKRGAFVFGDYVDERQDAHIYDLKSAGVAVPIAIDQIYTGQPIP